jgi:hypothetical protein
MKGTILLLFSCMTFGGCCGTISFAPTKTEYTSTVVAPPDQIEVYRTEKPQSPYTEIGSIQCTFGGAHCSQNLESIIDKMKVEASQRGGNAIVDLQILSDTAVGTVVRFNK